MATGVRWRFVAFLGGLLVAAAAGAVRADELAIVRDVELQPLAAQVERVSQALELVGAPLTSEQQESLKRRLLMRMRRKRSSKSRRSSTRCALRA
ncbi:MAG: hypothetical protein U0805_01040 [Pirellulales bacterium]